MAATGFAYTRSGDQAGAVHPIPLSNEGEDRQNGEDALDRGSPPRCCPRRVFPKHPDSGQVDISDRNAGSRCPTPADADSCCLGGRGQAGAEACRQASCRDSAEGPAGDDLPQADPEAQALHLLHRPTLQPPAPVLDPHHRLYRSVAGCPPPHYLPTRTARPALTVPTQPRRASPVVRAAVDDLR